MKSRVRQAMHAGLAIFAVGAVWAQTPPSSGEIAAGQLLAERDCVACHRQKFGNSTSIYTRAERKVMTSAQLAAQVSFCNTQLGTNYFPDEEQHVVAFLNARYYHFKP